MTPPRGDIADWTTDSPGLSTYWGTAEKAYLLKGGRPLLIFGNGGASKSLMALRLSLGLVGVDGFSHLLGQPVTPIPEDESVLYLALDGPGETRASFARLQTPDGREVSQVIGPRFIVVPRLSLSPGHEDSGAVAAYIRQLEGDTAQSVGVVVIDNLVKLYGDVSQPSRAAFASTSLAALEADGRGLVVVTQSKKNTKPRAEDDALLVQGALFGMGTILSLYKTREGSREGDADTVAELRHYKGPGADGGKALAVSIDLPSGRMTVEAEKDLKEQAANLPEVGTFNRADIEKALVLKRSAAQAFAEKATVAGLIVPDHEGARGAQFWRRGIGK